MTTEEPAIVHCADTQSSPALETAAPTATGGSAREVRDELLKLAVIAAHQLKSPLHSIQTSLNLLMGGFVGPIPANQRELLDNANRSAMRGSNLVSDLLRLRGLDVLSVDDLVPVNVVDALRTALERVRDSTEAKRIELSEALELNDPTLGWVLAEPSVVQEVLFVLLENAVKYTPNAGRVRVRVFVPGQAWELPEGAPPPEGCVCGQIACEVVDTGIGIPPAAWPDLFTEFFRAPNARRSSREGTGLGLAFADRAVRLMRGRLRLEPATAGGVKALLVLPCSPPRADGREAGSAARSARRISQRVVVVGGVSAGAKAAARIARLDPDAEVTVVEKGQFLSYAGCGLPYYISGTVQEQRALLSSPLGDVRDSSFFHALKNVRTLDQTEARSIDRAARKVRIRRLTDGQESELGYDHLVLATGARAAIPTIKGTRLDGVYTLHGVEDAEAIRSRLRDPHAKEVVIVGGGVLGCQITEAVALQGSRISLIEAQPSILGIVDPELAAHVEKHLARRGVRVHTGCAVTGIEGKDKVTGVRLASGRLLPCDFTILATGVQPRVSLAVQAGLELGSTGAVQVDDRQRSSDPHIYAVGDCAESRDLITGQATWVPTGSTATREGRVAASNICGHEQRSPGIVGSMVLKVFDWTVASTGLSADEARQAGYDPVTVLIVGPDRAHYLPTSQHILLKLVADASSRKVLGLQGIGPGEVAKRIDIVATALSAGLHLDQISQLDLAYAPPYSLALDNVVTAANVLQNKLDGLFDGITPLELHALLGSDTPPVLLDVRLHSEYGRVRLPDSLHIPLGALRGRLHEIPRDRAIITIGKIGLRAYEAALVLRHKGFSEVRVLDGGLDAWPFELEQL
jgi:NADPH-dependent 2,4-dienoyl-CoA reductase/sulfur reductase-like enzyme/rhodanese-related sulfurtransferase/nitrogen-specific signal transduction histidine kinase